MHLTSGKRAIAGTIANGLVHTTILWYDVVVNHYAIYQQKNPSELGPSNPCLGYHGGACLPKGRGEENQE